MSKDPLKEMLLKYPELELNGVPRKEANEFNNFRQEGLKPYSDTLKESFSSIAEKRNLELRIQQDMKKEAKEKGNLFNASISAADLKFEQKDYLAALKFYKTALDIEISIDKGYCILRIEHCEGVIKENNEKYDIFINEADTLFKQQNWQQAKEKYEAAIVLKPNEDYPKQQKNKCEKELTKGNLSLGELIGFSEFNSDSRKIIQNYFHANKDKISDNDISAVKDFVFRCAGDLSGKKLNNFMKPKKDPWKFLKSVGIDLEIVNTWHDEISKTKQ